MITYNKSITRKFWIDTIFDTHVGLNFLAENIGAASADLVDVANFDLTGSQSVQYTNASLQFISLGFDIQEISIEKFDSNWDLGEELGVDWPTLIPQGSETVTQQQARVSEPSTFLLMSSALTGLGLMGHKGGVKNKWRNTIILIKKIVFIG